MLIIINLLLSALLLCSFIGYALFAKEILLLKQEFIPVFVFSSIAGIVYFCGLAGVLLAGSIVVMVLGLLILVFILFRSIQKGLSFRISVSMFQFFFLAGSLFFFILLLQSNLVHYDNFSHWAVVLKQMLITDAFPTATSALIDFKNYPLGITAFLYYVCRFAGHSQSIMLFAQGMLIFSCFYAMFGIISEKKRFLLYAFLGLGCSTLSLFNITIRISNLLVDFLLPIYTLAIFAVVYQYRTDIKRACITVLPLAGLLTIIKSTGIIFAAIGLAFLTYTWVAHRKKPSLKSGLILIGTVFSSFLPYLGWSWRMKTVFQGIENKFDVSASSLQNIQTGKSLEQIREITLLFLKSSADISTRPTMGIIVFNLGAIAASVFAAVVLKKKWNLWKVLILLDIVLLLYYTGILGLYLYSMPLDEALWLAGFERYASSIVVLFAGGLILCATTDIENSFYYKIGEVPDYRAFKDVRSKNRYQEGILACMAIAITLLMSEFNGILSITRSYDDTLPHKIHTVIGDRWYENGEEDKSKYLIYVSDIDQQVTNFYAQYVARYFLYASNVDGICLFYEDNMNNLLSGYDYLVIVESDADEIYLLQKHFGVSGQEGIYRIERSGEKIHLTLL